MSTESMSLGDYAMSLASWLRHLCPTLTQEQFDNAEGLQVWWATQKAAMEEAKAREAKRAKEQEERERAEYQRLAEKYGPGANG